MRALIIVDVQNDFLPGGALAVPQGDEVISVINGLSALCDFYDVVVATQDWHPKDHGSFAANQDGEIGEVIDLDGLPQILWPVHCVQGSRGAEFPETLDCGRISRVFTKGANPQVDSYSGFFDNGQRESTGLAAHLEQLGVTEVHVVGLATDYCVKFTALDAVALGFNTTLIRRRDHGNGSGRRHGPNG